MRPKKLTPKQQRFAVEYVRCGNASDAYRAAYNTDSMAPSTIQNEAWRLTVHHEIAERIDELQLAHARTVSLEQIDVLVGLRELIDRASDAGQFGAVVRAWELLGRSIGMFSDRTDVRGVIQHVIRPLEAYSDDDLRVFIDGTPDSLPAPEVSSTEPAGNGFKP